MRYLTTNCMKIQLTDSESLSYSRFLAKLRTRLVRKFGSQKRVADKLCIDPANFSRIITGVVDCNSKLVFKMIELSGMVVIDDPLTF